MRRFIGGGVATVTADAGKSLLSGMAAASTAALCTNSARCFSDVSDASRSYSPATRLASSFCHVAVRTARSVLTCSASWQHLRHYLHVFVEFFIRTSFLLRARLL